MTLDELIDEADRSGKWLNTYYQNLWFTPAQLRKENQNGKFCWSAENFSLRDPVERMRELNANQQKAAAEYERVNRMLGRG